MPAAGLVPNNFLTTTDSMCEDAFFRALNIAHSENFGNGQRLSYVVPVFTYTAE